MVDRILAMIFNRSSHYSSPRYAITYITGATNEHTQTQGYISIYRGQDQGRHDSPAGKYDLRQDLDHLYCAGGRHQSDYILYVLWLQEELLHEICDSFLDPYLESMMRALTTNDKAEQRNIIRTSFKVLLDMRLALIGIWQVHLEEFDPYLTMERSVEQTVYRYLEENDLTPRNNLPRELFANLYTANAMATVKWLVYHPDQPSAEDLIWMIQQCEQAGIVTLLQ